MLEHPARQGGDAVDNHTATCACNTYGTVGSSGFEIFQAGPCGEGEGGINSRTFESSDTQTCQ